MSSFFFVFLLFTLMLVCLVVFFYALWNVGLCGFVCTVLLFLCEDRCVGDFL